MAAYVITPSGELFEYPTANHAVRKDGFLRLSTSNEGSWVADVPHNFVVGWARPVALGSSGSDLAKTKRALRNFDARTGDFKP